MTRLDLVRQPILAAALRSRWPQFAVQIGLLIAFGLAIAAGLLGTPVGSANFGIVFVWIAWWALLMLILVPLLGRAWCAVCPIPLPGEWLQRGALLDPAGQGLGLGRRWPARLRNIWLQNGAFVLVALFSAVVLTQPGVSALVLAAFLFTALGASLVFERRAFCRYLCPVGGFIGLYAQAAPLELRVIDPARCATHLEKTCYTGSADAHGCPWQIYPGGLSKNTYCGMCLECLRACPHDNVAINLRPFGADLAVAAGRRLDEAFKALIMLGAAIVYSAVMLGPWGALKTAAFSIGSAEWAIYALAFLALILAGLPGAFAAAVLLGRRWAGAPRLGLRRGFVHLAYALAPLGLTAWIAFSLSFVFANLSYLWPVASDPFGWGWDLFGTARLGWQPYLMSAVPFLQTLALIGGLAWAASTARRIAGGLLPSPAAARRLTAPVVGYCFALTSGLLWLLVG